MGNVVTFGAIVTCGEYYATVDVNSAALADLGVQLEDYVVIHNESVYLDGINDLEPECKVENIDDTGVSLKFNLTQCYPTVEQTSSTITYKWIVRNAEQSVIKRIDACAYVTCEYDRNEEVKSDYINTTIDKTFLDDVFGNGDFSLVLNTYTAADREITTQEYTVPDRIFARVEFENRINIPDTWYIQIDYCYVADDPDFSTESITIIEDGVDDDTYCDVTVDAPPFVPNQEDFSFDSFVWTDPAIANQLWICCDVYYCTEDAPGIDCSTALVDPIVRRKRSANRYDFPYASVKSGPITVY